MTTPVVHERWHHFSESEVTVRKVLFASDFSAACENAWSYALALSRSYQSKLFLVHVIAPSQFASVPPELLVEAHHRARLNAEHEMKRIQQLQGGTAGLDVEMSILEGDISELLLRFEKDQHVDLLVVGTRGHRDLNRLLLGSVAEKLFRQSHCPVLVVPERVRSGRIEPVHRILYPTDFLRESAHARAHALALAQHFQAQLILMHVVKDASLKSADDLSQERMAVLDTLRGFLPGQVGLPGVHFEVAFGEPARNISRIAAEYAVDLIVIGVHPAAQTAAHEQERTAYRVILSALCPVLTVPKSNRILDEDRTQHDSNDF